MGVMLRLTFITKLLATISVFLFVDFGLSNIMPAGKMLKTHCGSPAVFLFIAFSMEYRGKHWISGPPTLLPNKA